ncbi:protein ANTAGONIST OF LIKE HETEROCHROMATIN PROTEIN 1-like [Salarias fasciatus]|uniref:protein ANTAGONIST OF LIKE HETEROCHROMATIN PROTEIN 1-like n=1 Tax=Salarias fasciatus TaxID=181472 RepID=UPI001176ECD3|nr:protein ANTAGONIST OF LIKE HETEROCHROMATIN PROTEIN 1-like [Salarias fasciatus]
MADRIRRVAWLYLLNKARQRRRRAHGRRLWVHPIIQRRSEFGEFHHLLQELREDEGRFQGYFRLSRAQFDDLLARIGARITLQDTNYRRSIPPEERLSICLRFLATGDSYRTIASSFRVGISTVSQIIPQVVTVIWESLVEEFMPVPGAEEWRSIAEEFEERWNFPLCCGAVDGKHIQMKAPPNSGSLYFNYKLHHSLVLLAVVDARYRFRVIDVGGYGRTSDGGIFANSAFGQALRAGTLDLPPNQHLPGADHRGSQPHVFVADEVFPLRPYLMRPFPGRGGLTLEQRIFNYRLSRARLVVEDAFGIWSSQWRMFRTLLEIHPEVVEKCVKATCVLHNFMRMSADGRAPAFRGAVEQEEPLPGVRRMGANNATRDALNTRDVFMAHFCEEGAVPWQPAE